MGGPAETGVGMYIECIDIYIYVYIYVCIERSSDSEV